MLPHHKAIGEDGQDVILLLKSCHIEHTLTDAHKCHLIECAIWWGASNKMLEKDRNHNFKADLTCFKRAVIQTSLNLSWYYIYPSHLNIPKKYQSQHYSEPNYKL